MNWIVSVSCWYWKAWTVVCVANKMKNSFERIQTKNVTPIHNSHRHTQTLKQSDSNNFVYILYGTSSWNRLTTHFLNSINHASSSASSLHPPSVWVVCLRLGFSKNMMDVSLSPAKMSKMKEQKNTQNKNACLYRVNQWL